MEQLDAVKDFLHTAPLMVTSTFLVLLLGILYLITKNRNLPPGPWGLPYLGYWPFLKSDQAHVQLQKLTKKYGDVYSLTITGKLLIHLGSIKAVKEAHVSKADCFSARNTSFNVLDLLFDGIATLNGEPWKIMRKFFVQGFREFGLTSMKDYLSGPVYDAVNGAVNKLKSEQGKPINFRPILTMQSSLIMRRMLFNDGGITEEELNEITENYEKSVLLFFIGTRGILSGELVRYVIYPLLPGYKTAMKHHGNIINTLKKVIKRHEDTFDEGNMRDFIDVYIKERTERKKNNDPSAEYFTDRTLVYSALQFVGDGVMAVAMFISFFLYATILYPEEQEKVYKELVEVTGTDRQPTLEDKNKLTYTNAFIQEVIRTNDFFTLVQSLECTKETTINGCQVPVGAVTLVNLWSCHNDPNTFEDPQVFRPSRYIPQPGNPKTELPILFGAGKRACAGESFTMMQVFLFFTTIIKHFRLSRPDNFSDKNFMDGSMEIVVHEREQPS